MADIDPAKNNLIQGDCLQVLLRMRKESYDLIYIDPPFNTGVEQKRTTLATSANADGDRGGFGGKRYSTEVVGECGYSDKHEDYIAFLKPRLVEAYRVLAPDGSLFFHIDYREAHYCKVLLDEIFGRGSFKNEIIWAYDFGGRSKTRWPAKHDNIFWFAKNPERYTFNYEAMERIPYMAPGLVGPEKAAIGKTPTDVWWHTIVSPTGKEKTGYPNQKPIAILERIISVHSNSGDAVLDYFAGSGTTGAAAQRLDRTCTLIDSNEAAIEIVRKRLPDFQLIGAELAK